ncbi:uncharacterized protein BDR25DRAFT_267560 [Lindgomyces ingoldianus]|uniref:Uncharacterized protein n=1 Tax=Lindgomyces ingoldianus TaxID=673940 RepID=A0ACB6QJU9_9PLEO|nr:uncharacterized protein BDR25DRAFT_267560 [Lindgomyces ingoldianus]KAF2466853.1 hypothetical protein BDR25DRAFT_267560 [Lindgomyces ingoldianus]
MHFKALLLSAPVVLANVYTIDVGESPLTFSPKTISAKVGDTVIFHLYSSHDVAQGSFDKPCQPLSGGFYSGPFSGTDNGNKKFVMNVTSTDPIYFYCAVQKHCPNGMVGGINIPSGDKSIEAYASAAKAATPSAPASLSGGKLETDQELAALTASASATASASRSASGSASTGAASGTPAASGSSKPSGSATAAASGTASAKASSTGAADALIASQGYGIVAAAFGVVAWFL